MSTINIRQIESNVKAVVDNCNEDNFIYDFLLAYGVCLEPQSDVSNWLLKISLPYSSQTMLLSRRKSISVLTRKMNCLLLSRNWQTKTVRR